MVLVVFWIVSECAIHTSTSTQPGSIAAFLSHSALVQQYGNQVTTKGREKKKEQKEIKKKQKRRGKKEKEKKE